MSDPHKLINMFTADEITQLQNIYTTRKGARLYQDYNLFNVVKKDINVNNPVIKPYIQKMSDYCKVKPRVAYFLKYKKNSFAKIHIDNPDNNRMTSITMVRASDDLVGGESIITKLLEKSDIGSGTTTIPDRSSKKWNFIGKPIIPVVVKQPLGSTLWYDINTYHGVTRVEQGLRIVLVTWFGGE